MIEVLIANPSGALSLDRIIVLETFWLSGLDIRSRQAGSLSTKDITLRLHSGHSYDRIVTILVNSYRMRTPLSGSDIHEGDSSVVTRWTVDQEVVGSNPTHGGNLISVVRSLSGFTQPIR